MRSKILGWVFVCAFLVSACSLLSGGAVARSKLDRNTTPIVSLSDRQSVVDGNGAFAFDFYCEVRGQDGNLVYSPYSIALATSMVYGGAQGNTATQIAETLHFMLPQSQFHPVVNSLALEIANRPAEAREVDRKSKMEMNIANAIWSLPGYPLEPAYLDLLAVNYGAGIRLVDFVNDPIDASRQINTWVLRETKGKIEQIASPDMFDAYSRMALTNAIYFKANWKEAFVEDETAPGSFTLLDGSQVMVDMMQTDDEVPLGYMEDEGYFVVSLPYKGDQAEMIILVPDLGTFSDFESELTLERFNTLTGDLEDARFKLFMPKFEFTSDFDLKTTLSDMGMPDAFDRDRADFSVITPFEPLFLQQGLHKAYILVNEEGTEAAAATFFLFGAGSAGPPPDVHIDRPFIFVIRDKPTEMILFVGRVLNPLEN